ncbi:MAG: radical SAM protein [Deltaproteobacteria bacterium]|nr:radical SAM protein [Deltaproteobacteria bacterium]
MAEPEPVVGSGLVDPQGRHLTYLRLGITERCDLHCAYCNVAGATSDGREELPLADLRTLGVAFARRLGFHKLRLTGGEPLMRSDLPEIVRAMRDEAGFPRIALTTNGRLLARRVRALAAAGVQQVNISLDTLCAGAYREVRGADALDDVLRGIDAALAAGLARVKVNVVLLRSVGFSEFDSFLAWGAGRPIELRFIELMPIDGLDEFHRREHVSSEPLIDRILDGGFVPQESEPDAGPAVVYARSGDPLRVGFVSAITKPFCERCNRLRVTPRGALKLCLFGRGFVDLRPFLAQGPEAVADVVRRAIVDREDGFRSIGRPVGCEADRGMRGIGG